MITISVEDNAVELNTVINNETKRVSSVREYVENVADDYELLKNKPSLDGVEIIKDIHEQDPTIYQWAKKPIKPSYVANEVDAVPIDDIVTIAEINNIFNGLN